MGSVASDERSWNVSASLTASLLPAASIQNDLNQAGPGGQSANSKGQTTSSLEEKSRLLAEVAVTLQEENTTQEKILALTKRLAILRGQDPDRGRG